ncbi:histidine phosphatase family protein [Pseudaestuariivita rosea]|uniref:histidine phosphatase family protein n=1 Tax=Pseudaestuariivita rosea TaxID=2763263 RepID=UPI001F35D6A9
MVGWSDLPADLSDTGQVARLAAYLPDDAVIVSSDLTRAVQTADAIAGKRRRLAHDCDLREMHFGAWELRSFSQIEAEDPERIRAFWDHPGDVRPPGGESWDDISQRATRAVDGLLQSGVSHVIIVAHFGTILTQLQRALGITAYEAFGHRIDNLSVTELSVNGDDWSVQRINHRP